MHKTLVLSPLPNKTSHGGIGLQSQNFRGGERRMEDSEFKIDSSLARSRTDYKRLSQKSRTTSPNNVSVFKEK